MQNDLRGYYEEENPYDVRNLSGAGITRAYHKKFLNESVGKKGKILDLGCGTAEMIFKLKQNGWEVWGVDFDRNAIKIAKRRFKLKNLFSDSFEDFFRKNQNLKFDTITFFEVLEHLQDPENFILNCRNILKPGGNVFISTPFRRRLFPNSNSWDFPPHHFTRWDEKSLQMIFEKNGFSVEKITFVEEIKILSEALISGLKTNIVSKTMKKGGENNLRLAKVLFVLGKAKHFVFGYFPATLIFIYYRITKRRGGLMYAEFSLKK